MNEQLKTESSNVVPVAGEEQGAMIYKSIQPFSDYYRSRGHCRQKHNRKHALSAKERKRREK